MRCKERRDLKTAFVFNCCLVCTVRATCEVSLNVLAFSSECASCQYTARAVAFLGIPSAFYQIRDCAGSMNQIDLGS